MQRFFNNSLTGICSLVSDQCKQVTNATGKMPKVGYRLRDVEIQALFANNSENSARRWAGRFSIHPQCLAGSV